MKNKIKIYKTRINIHRNKNKTPVWKYLLQFVIVNIYNKEKKEQ
jgi:hypothetical protein